MSPLVGHWSAIALRRYWYFASLPLVADCAVQVRSIAPAVVAAVDAEKPVGTGTTVVVPRTDRAADISELDGTKRTSTSCCRPPMRSVSV